MDTWFCGCGEQVFKAAILTSVLAVESDRVLLVGRLDQLDGDSQLDARAAFLPRS
jgi:hypothetical protein